MRDCWLVSTAGESGAERGSPRNSDNGRPTCCPRNRGRMCIRMSRSSRPLQSAASPCCNIRNWVVAPASRSSFEVCSNNFSSVPSLPETRSLLHKIYGARNAAALVRPRGPFFLPFQTFALIRQRQRGCTAALRRKVIALSLYRADKGKATTWASSVLSLKFVYKIWRPRRGFGRQFWSR